MLGIDFENIVFLRIQFLNIILMVYPVIRKRYLTLSDGYVLFSILNLQP